MKRLFIIASLLVSSAAISNAQVAISPSVGTGVNVNSRSVGAGVGVGAGAVVSVPKVGTVVVSAPVGLSLSTSLPAVSGSTPAVCLPGVGVGSTLSGVTSGLSSTLYTTVAGATSTVGATVAGVKSTVGSVLSGVTSTVGGLTGAACNPCSTCTPVALPILK